MAFYELNPWGPWRDNLHSAQLASLYANAHAPKGKSFGIDDFLYRDPDTVKVEQDQDVFQGLMAIAAKAKKVTDD